MKEYRVMCIDHKRPDTIPGKGYYPYNQKVFEKYVRGLKEARRMCSPAKLSYCYNAKCFIGYISDKKIEYLVKEV